MFSTKNITRFILFFTLFYFEPLSLGNISFAQTWKILLYIGFISFIIIKKTFIPRESLTSSFYHYAIKDLINLSMFVSPSYGIIHFLKFLNLPLLLHFFSTLVNFNHRNLTKLYKFSYLLSIFIILSGIPFLFNILKPLGVAYDISAYSTEGKKGFVGIFQNSHSTSYFTAFCIINLLHFYIVQSKKYKKFTILVIGLGLYELFATYVRGGLLVLFVGVFFYFGSKINIKTILRLCGVAILLFGMVLYLINSDETFKRRLFDENEYNENTTTIGKYGSGRFLFVSTNLDYYLQGDLITKLIGYGEELPRINMEKKIGLKIYSHNGFMDSLVQNGLIGIFLFFKIFYRYFKTLYAVKHNIRLLQLCKANFYMYLFFQFVQGGVYFLMEVLIALNLVVLLQIEMNLKLKGGKNE